MQPQWPSALRHFTVRPLLAETVPSAEIISFGGFYFNLKALLRPQFALSATILLWSQVSVRVAMGQSPYSRKVTDVRQRKPFGCSLDGSTCAMYPGPSRSFSLSFLTPLFRDPRHVSPVHSTSQARERERERKRERKRASVLLFFHFSSLCDSLPNPLNHTSAAPPPLNIIFLQKNQASIVNL